MKQVDVVLCPIEADGRADDFAAKEQNGHVQPLRERNPPPQQSSTVLEDLTKEVAHFQRDQDALRLRVVVKFVCIPSDAHGVDTVSG
eukprot:176623-Prymnesium_polylepis.3